MTRAVDSLVVLCGGACGALCRVALQNAISALAGPEFPYGILCANILGSFALGVLNGVLSRKTSSHTTLYLLCGTGFLGGFTTFSTFSANTFSLYAAGQNIAAAMNILANVGLCIAAAGMGMRAGTGKGRRGSA